MQLRNFIIAYRNLNKHALHSFVNVLGLAVGITACLVIALILKSEWTYDSYHERATQIYRVNYWTEEEGQRQDYNVTPDALAGAIKDNVSDVEMATQLQLTYGTSTIKSEEEYFQFDELSYIQPGYFETFDYKILYGDLSRKLLEPNQVVLTQSVSQQLFGTDNPVGREIELNYRHTVSIVAVVDDPPSNSHLPFKIFVSYATIERQYEEWAFSDGNVTYVVLGRNHDSDIVNGKIQSLLHQYQPSELAAASGISLQALGDIHTDVTYDAYRGSFQMSEHYLWGLLVIGLLILLSAIINFVNQSTALSWQRSKEVAMRKVLGSGRGQLIFQFLTETYFLVISATVVAVLIASWGLPWVVAAFGIPLSLSDLIAPSTVIALVVGVVILGLLAGFYPAFVLSKRKMTYGLKGVAEQGTLAGQRVYRGLTGFQFTISHFLLMGALIIFCQMQFISQKDLGFESNNRIMIKVSDEIDERQSFKNALSKLPHVSSVTYCMGGPTKSGTLRSEMSLRGKREDNFRAKVIPIESSYVDAFDIAIIAGNDLPRNQEYLERSTATLINESMVSELGFSDPLSAIGEMVEVGDFTSDMGDFQLEIVGVVADFHQKSLHNKIEPAVLFHWPRWTHVAGIEIRNADISNMLGEIEGAYTGSFPNRHFSYSFLDDYIFQLYTADRRILSLLKIFTVIAIFISCLGLFAMVSISGVRRRREIGIRKILGAGVATIVSMLTREYLLIAVLTWCAAIPIVLFFSTRWLDNFSYHISISWWLFLAAGIVTTVLAFLTMGMQSISAATANPIESIRSE